MSDIRSLAIEYNQRTWTLLEQDARNAAEDAEMVTSAHTSFALWAKAGTAVHRQRGLWLIARVYSVLGEATLAAKYANQCRAVTEAHRDQMKDFDLVYALEAEARVLAISGKSAEAAELKAQVVSQAQGVEGAEDRRILVADIEALPWAPT